MELHYIKPDLLDRWHPGVGPSAAEVRAILEEGVIKDGTPLFLDAQMRPIEYLSGWFRHLSMRHRDRKTMRQYAYLIRSLVHFLEQRGTSVLLATEADLTAFRRSRTELQEEPIDDGTWDRDAGVIDRLYGWLLDNGHVKRRPVRLDGDGRNPLASGITRGMDIRHFAPDQYLYFRDVGLGGQLPDATLNLGFRGWYPHRSRAGLELALLTGMRKQEWSTTLLPELGFFDGYRPTGSTEFDLQACAKYGMHRVVYAPVAARAMLSNFFMLERDEIADTSARSLARRARDLFVVTDIDHSTGKLTGTYQGRRRVFVMQAMDPEMRRVTVFERDGGGLEAMAIFIGHGGLMIGPSSWDAIRKDAWTRMTEHAGHPSAPQLPRKVWRFHDARHTFALQLLRHLKFRQFEQRRELEAGAAISPIDILDLAAITLVQKRLGHKHLSSTYHYVRYMDDPMKYVDDAFRQWTQHDGATYTEIAAKAMTLGLEASHAPAR
ncbi:hypothetical protein ACIQOW_36645 [Kitasatospora sp. NPDC091335]|uniref:hypothetical protein n=1 Tax=Kitasatospora sp. NPDC091335 TaxID=3364085 RepID=UPI0037F8A687